MATTWQYEVDENPKRKHHWEKNEPGFVKVGNTLIGKCPANLDPPTCERALNAGLPWSGRGWDKDYPERIYCVLDGTVYRATPTSPGRSYHGFPELLERLPADRRLRESLLVSAKAEGEESEAKVRKWLRS